MRFSHAKPQNRCSLLVARCSGSKDSRHETRNARLKPQNTGHGTRDTGPRLSIAAWLMFFCLLSTAGPGQAADNLRHNAVVKAVERVSPAVANIGTERIVVQQYHPFGSFVDPRFNEFFGLHRSYEREYKVKSLGSGVLIHPQGFLLTNEHVVSKASRIFVTLSDGVEHEGTLISSDATQDLAVVRIKADKPLPFITFANSRNLLIGEPAIALGNPFGLEHTVTVGVVSARNRSISSERGPVLKDLIQTDASINPGNSGGPLVNIHGQLIGLNTAIYAEAEGIGFAIPAHKIKDSLLELLDPARVGKIWTGLKAQDTAKGLRIKEIEADGPADIAGLKAGDLIRSLDSCPVKNRLDFYLAMLCRHQGDTFKLKVSRGNISLAIALPRAAVAAPSAGELAWKKLGLRVSASSLGMGATISSLRRKGPAHIAGLKKGDLVYQMGRYRIQDVDDFNALLMYIKRNDTIIIQLIRGKYRMYSEVKSD